MGRTECAVAPAWKLMSGDQNAHKFGGIEAEAECSFVLSLLSCEQRSMVKLL